MRAFEFAAPATVREAIGLLGEEWGAAEVLAGGTDLLNLLKDDVVRPERVVSLARLTDPAIKSGVRRSGEGWRIGALTSLAALLEALGARGGMLEGVRQAAEGVASVQVRNRGTVGGDLCQRPRCWYFRRGFGLLARDAQGRSLVPSGENRYHAILGNPGPAYFVSPSSLAPPLIALGASVTLAGADATRQVRLEEFYRAPANENERETVLRPNEILTEVLVPATAGEMRSATYEVRQRAGLDWPLATASVALRMDGDRVAEARVVLGQVAPVPWVAREAAAALAGKPVNEETAAAAAELATRGARPFPGNAYKVRLARVAVKRALLAAAQA